MPYDGPGIVAPADFPIRDPRSRPRMQGRVVNPVGYMERPNGETGIGGFDGPAKLPGHGSNLAVQAPTSLKPATSSNMGSGGMRKKK